MRNHGCWGRSAAAPGAAGRLARLARRRLGRRRPAIALGLAILASVAGAAAQECKFPLAHYGARYRFTSGDFRATSDRTTWVHFLTRPVIVSVAREGPSTGRLAAGDVVTSVDGRLITTEDGSYRFHFPDRRVVTFVVERGGQSVRVEVEPELSCRVRRPWLPPEDASLGNPRGTLGIRFRCESCGLRVDDDGGYWEFEKPPVVTEIADGSPAECEDVRVGDHLLAIDGASVITTEGGRRFSSIAPGETVVLRLLREGRRLEVVLTAEALQPAGRMSSRD